LSISSDHTGFSAEQLPVPENNLIPQQTTTPSKALKNQSSHCTLFIYGTAYANPAQTALVSRRHSI
jgi:hypothetical protein